MCVFVYLFSSIDLSLSVRRQRRKIEETYSRAGQRCHHASSYRLDRSFLRSVRLLVCFIVCTRLRMVKWKLVTIVLASLLLLLLTYLTRQRFPQQLNYFIHDESNSSGTTLVFIHIQKTAGSEFERSIVRRLQFGTDASCQCPRGSRFNRTKRPNVKLRCNCLRDNEPWLISRFSVGWICGVHADWTTYHRCLPAKMNFDYGSKSRK